MKGGNNMAKIGKRAGAKKYAELRELQTRVNHMLYKSTHIEKSNAKRQAVLQMKRQFYKSRGIKNPAKLSFKSLSKKDIKAYEQLLKSIESNTYINPEKYKKFQEKMREKFNEQDWGFEYDDIKDILENDIVNMLYELGLTPSEFWAFYDYYTRSYGTPEEVDDVQGFWDMLRAFVHEVNWGDMDVHQLFAFADRYQNDEDYRRSFEDIL